MEGLFICLYLIVMNVLTFIVYGIDKQKAKRGKWRISEKTLMMLAVFGGSIGAWIGMQVFRHKTKHLLFVIGVPLIFFCGIRDCIGSFYVMREEVNIL